MNRLIAAMMQRAADDLRWVAPAQAYSGKWRVDIVKAREQLDQLERACLAVEAAEAQHREEQNRVPEPTPCEAAGVLGPQA